MPTPKKNNGRPNLAIRTAQILANVAKTELSAYSSNLIDLKNDADDLNKTLSQGVTTAKETFNDFRRNGMKKFIDWFYSSADDTEDSDLFDEESDFEAEIKTDDLDEEETPKSKVLDEDSMKNIAKGQVNALYKITGKQVEASVMSTAEIVSTIKDQSSLIVTQLETTNSKLSSIDTKLDAMLKLQAAGMEQQSELTESDGGFFNEDGNITLKTFIQGIKEAISESEIGTGIETLSGMKDMMTPEMIVSAIIDKTGIKDKKFSLFGDRSINELGELFNETIGNTISAGFGKLMDSKLFGKIEELTHIDFREGYRNTDYGSYVKNQYTKDKAVFDNMTRQTIISVIPEYLKLITGALTGKSYHVNSHGRLSSEPQQNEFEEKAKSTTLSFGTGLSNRAERELIKTAKKIDVNIETGTLTAIGQMIVSSCVDWMEENSVGVFTAGTIGEAQQDVNKMTLQALLDANPGTAPEYWSKLIRSYWVQVRYDIGTRETFCRMVMKAYHDQHKQLVNLAQNTTQPENLKSITGTRAKIIAENKFGAEDQKSDKEIKIEKLEEEIEKLEKMSKSKSLSNDKRRELKDLQRTRDRLQEEIDRHQSLGDSTESKTDTIKASHKVFTKQFEPSKGFKNFQKDVSKTLHDILDILKVGFGNPIIPGDNGPQPTPPKVTPKRYKLTSRSRPTLTQPHQSDDSGEESSDEPPNPPKPSKTPESISDDQQDDGISHDQSSSTTNEEKNGIEEILTMMKISMLNQDGIQQSDSPIFSQLLSGIKNSNFVMNTRTFFNKITKRGETKKDEEKKEEKKGGGILGLLGGGIKKILTPLSGLLMPITNMLTGKGGLMSKMFGKNFEGIKKGFQQIKEGATESIDKATGGKFSKTVDSVKNKIKNPEETGIGSTDESSKATGKPETEITDELKDNDDHAESRHKELMDLLKDIRDNLKSEVKTDGVTDGKTEVKNSEISGIGNENTKTDVDKYKSSDNLGSIKVYNQDENGFGNTDETNMNQVPVGGDPKNINPDSVNPEAGGKKKGILGKLGGIGKAVGGIGNIMLMVATIVSKIVLSLAAVKTLMNLAIKTVTKAIKPLNKAVKALTKMIKPLLKQLGSIISKMADAIVGVISGLGKVLMPVLSIISKTLSGLMKIIEPVLDVLVKFIDKVGDLLGNFFQMLEGVFDKLSPIFEMLGSAVSQILETITGLVTDLLEPLLSIYGNYIKIVMDLVMDVITPIVSVVTSVLVPAVKTIAGVIQIGFGMVQVGFGNLLLGIGKILHALDPMGVVNADDSIMDAGQNMIDGGKGMLQKGMSTFREVGGSIAGILGINSDSTINSEIQSLFKELRDQFMEIVDMLKEMWNEFIKPFKDTFDEIGKDLKEFAQDIIIPFFAELKADIIPAFQLLTGIVATGFGAVITGIGTIVKSLGTVGGIFSNGIGGLMSGLLGGVAGNLINALGGNVSKVMTKAGDSTHTIGIHLTQIGIRNMKAGYAGLFGSVESELGSMNINTDVSSELPEREVSSGFSMDGTMSANVDTTYGSGDQASYGSYLNMNKRGCGPIALADAASRRTGSKVDARKLAGSMYSTGDYSTSRGTSVSGFINTAGSMGLGYKVGGVNANSLKSASPVNPITVVGSGNGYDTRRGNTHYVNVIGTKNGIAYTSNPMTGRVERRSIGDITAGALMGLYGSGDIASQFSLGDGLSDLFEELSELAGGLLNIFNFDDADDLKTKQENEEYKVKYNSIKAKYGSDKMKQFESEAFQEWSKNNPRRSGESATNYLSRWNKVSMKQTVNHANEVLYQEELERSGILGDNVADSASAVSGVYDAETGTWGGGALQIASSLLEALGLDMATSTGSVGGGVSSSSGSGGSVLGVIPTVIRAYEAAGVVGKSGDYNQWGRTHKLNINGQEYVERPDCTGLCDTVIDVMGYNSEKMNSASFNSAKGIKDKSGNISPDWEFHNNPALSDFQPGDIGIIYQGGNHHGEIYAATENGRMYGYNYGDDGPIAKCLKAVNLMQSDGLDVATAAVKAGSGINGHHKYTRLIRYVGAGSNNTPTSSYDLNNAAAAGAGMSTGSGGSSAQGEINMSTLTPYYKNTWNSYKNKNGITEYFNAARQAGMSPAQQALMMSVGIWEDGARKLTGEKDLTKVTYDKNHQAAFGIMNWIPKNIVNGHDSSYGNTMSDQLKYIASAYFGPNPTRNQGRINGNINQYRNALTKLTGRELIGKQGDAIGPIIDSNLIEGAGHYTGVALVPEGWNTPQGLGKYIGTAVDVYNWMVQNGMATGQYSSYGVGGTGGGSGFGAIGSRVQSLLSDGSLNSFGDKTLGSAISAAIKNGTLKLSDAASLAKDTLFEATDSTKSIVNTAIEDTKANGSNIINGIKSIIGNRITTAGEVVSNWWNNVKQIVTKTEPTPDGILATFKDIGSSIYDTGTGIVGSIKDDFGQESQLVWNGVTKELSIIKGAAEDVAEEIANGISTIASSIIDSQTYGDDTKGSKLDNLIKGSYGIASSFNNALFQTFASSIGVLSNNSSGSSYASDSVYDSSDYDEETTGNTTIVSVADNGDMWNGYNQSVNSRMAAHWKAQIEEGRKEWGNYGKNHKRWYNKWLSTNPQSSSSKPNRSIADYYRQNYPSLITSEFNEWYADAFGTAIDMWTAQSQAAKNNKTTIQQNAIKNINQPFDMFGNITSTFDQIPSLNPNNRGNKSKTTTTSNGKITPVVEYAVNGINAAYRAGGVYGRGDETEEQSQIVIPPVDEFAIQQQLGDMQQEEQTPTIVNQFLVGKNTTDNTDWIAQLEQVTFNVRAERIEELLEEISKKMDSVNGNTTVISTPQPTPTESPIPDQVAMLARG